MSLWMVELSGTPTSLMLLKDAENRLMMIPKLQLMSLYALVTTSKEITKTHKNKMNKSYSMESSIIKFSKQMMV